MIFLSGSYLDSSVSSDNGNLYAKDYNLVGADHTENVTRGGACVYFKESLPISCLLNPYLKEYLIFEVSINNKRDHVVSMYNSRIQTSDDLNSFTFNLEKLIVNISVVICFILIVGDFNAKSSNWSSNETTAAEGAQLGYLKSLCGMKKVITESTHILGNSTSCIDLTFSNQPNLIPECIQYYIQNVTIK